MSGKKSFTRAQWFVTAEGGDEGIAANVFIWKNNERFSIKKPNGDKVTAVSVTSISVLDDPDFGHADDHPLEVN